MDIHDKINQLAEKLMSGKEDDVTVEAEKLAKDLTLKQMKSVIDLYLTNAVHLFQDPTAVKEMQVMLLICLNYGIRICNYLDEIAFGEYDWTQYEAIDLLCKMALIKGIRKQKTLKLIDENIDNFRYTSVMNTLQSIKYFKDESIVQKIYERQLSKFKEDYQDFIGVLEMYHYSNQVRIKQYLPQLKKIIIESSDNDYSVVAMSYIMRGNEDGEMIAYNRDGSIFNEEEGIEFIKLKAAIMYHLADETDVEVTNYLKFIKQHSKFETHKEYLINSVEI